MAEATGGRRVRLVHLTLLRRRGSSARRRRRGTPRVTWYFVYTREAHPGERVGHHETFEGKLANARLLRDEIGIRRPLLVDDLGGSAHRAYGSLPNMRWVIGRGGRIAYKAQWTSAANVVAFLDRYEKGRGRKPPSGAVAPYVSEQLEYRDVDREAFYERLRRKRHPLL